MADVKSGTRHYQLPSLTIPRDTLFGYPTRLIDRAVNYVEEIVLPEARTLSGELKITSHQKALITKNRDPEGFKMKALSYIPGSSSSKPLTMESAVTIDLRYKFPGNWAHALTNHLPLSILIADLLELEYSEISLIFPLGISQNILQIFRLSGFNTINTDNPVFSRNCQFHLTPWISLRGTRADIIRNGLSHCPLIKQLQASPKLYDKLYVARRNTRAIINETEIDEYLTRFGYKKVYMEDFSALDQLSLIFHAESIVAVHGAALGPQIFKVFSGKPYKLLEIFSPAHITDVYRVISHQTNGQWCAVRGKIWPELVSTKANFGNNLRNFEVSINSLELAMQKLNIN